MGVKNMKKNLAILLATIVSVGLLSGCAKKEEQPKTTTPNTPAASTPAQGTSSSNGIVKLGIGHITSIEKSSDLGKDKDGKDVLPVGQVDTIIAAVGFDKDGKVVKVTIDNAQTKVNFDKDLKVTSDLKAEQKTKVELGDAYGMVKASAIKKEWYQQIAELEKWMIGKSVNDIKAMKTVKKDDAHPAVPDVAELKSSVSVSVEGYIAAVEEAFKNAVEVKAGAVKVGLGHQVSIGSSKGVGKDKDGKDVLPLAQVDTAIVAAAFDKDGKIMGTLIDSAQTKVQYSKEGKVTSDKKAAPKTKVELKDEYGMVKASSIKKEWYQQADALGKWMVGKTADEVKAMKTVKKDDAHPAVPDVADLKTSVTMTVQDYIASVAEAAKNAK
jgi:uncharacterized protein YuzE